MGLVLNSFCQERWIRANIPIEQSGDPALELRYYYWELTFPWVLELLRLTSPLRKVVNLLYNCFLPRNFLWYYNSNHYNWEPTSPLSFRIVFKNVKANLPPEQGGDAAVLLAAPAAPQLHPLHLICLWRQNKETKQNIKTKNTKQFGLLSSSNQSNGKRDKVQILNDPTLNH